MNTINTMNTMTLRGLRTASQYSSFTSRIHSFNTHSPTKHLLLRQASTATTSPSHKNAINAPLTTLPAHLTLPVRQPSESLPRHLVATFKTYLTFYQTGLKNININYKASRPLQKLLDKKHNSSLTTAVQAHALNRSQFQLLTRNWHDIKRLPVFVLLLVVCGEYTPLLVIAFTAIVPWTCRIPKQIQSDRAKLEDRRRISFRNLTAKLPEKGGVEALSRMQLLHISWSLGLSSSFWDHSGGQLPGLPTGILRRKVARRVEYLEMDDKLIGRAGGVGDMDAEEVKMALVERGVDVLGKDGKTLKGELGAWLNSREKVSVERLLLTRPSAWPVKASEVKMEL